MPRQFIDFYPPDLLCMLLAYPYAMLWRTSASQPRL